MRDMNRHRRFWGNHLKRLAVLAAFAAAMPAFSLAGPASDAVKFFYLPEVKFEADAQYRDRFIEPATKLFELNDQAIAKNPDEVACIDFGPGLDAQDYDDATVGKTLQLSEKVDGDSAEVTAKFKLFPDGVEDEGSGREMLWSLKKVGGQWKVSDIASVTNDWKLSDLQCMQDAPE